MRPKPAIRGAIERDDRRAESLTNLGAVLAATRAA